MLYVREDVRRLYPRASLWRSVLMAFLSPRYHPVLLYRLSRVCVRLRLLPLAYLLSGLNLFLYRVEIALRTEIGPGLEIPHGNCVIGALRIGANFTIFQGCTIGARAGNLDDPQRPIDDTRPTIGNNVVMYTNSVLVGPITIGSDCVIGANTLVTDSVPDGHIVHCAPAIVRKRG